MYSARLSLTAIALSIPLMVSHPAFGETRVDLGPFAGKQLPFAHVDSPNPQFPLPKSLRSAVVFWEEVFVTYESTDLIIHDREQQSIIWGVYPVPADDGTRATRKRIQKRTDDLLASVRDSLSHLSSRGTPRNKWEQGAVSFIKTITWNKKLNAETSSKRVRAQRGVANDFRAGKKRAKPWLPKIEAELASRGLPKDLALMTFIESMFNTKAHSSAGAAGVWQLMPATAREFGLKVKRGHDDRMDILKATTAAAKLLARNHRMLESWPLAVTGYNHGAYGVKRAIRKVGSRKLEDLIEHYDKRTWGFASKNFYAELIAMIRIFNNQKASSGMRTTRDPQKT